MDLPCSRMLRYDRTRPGGSSARGGGPGGRVPEGDCKVVTRREGVGASTYRVIELNPESA